LVSLKALRLKREGYKKPCITYGMGKKEACRKAGPQGRYREKGEEYPYATLGNFPIKRTRKKPTQVSPRENKREGCQGGGELEGSTTKTYPSEIQKITKLRGGTGREVGGATFRVLSAGAGGHREGHITSPRDPGGEGQRQKKKPVTSGGGL